MSKVPDYNLKPLKPIYIGLKGEATLKQKNFILNLYAERKLPTPEVSELSKQEAATLIDNIINWS